MIYTIFDLSFEIFSNKEMQESLKLRLKKKEPTFVVTLNPEILLAMSANSGYKKVLESANLFLVDGFGLAFALSLIYRKNIQRFTGVDLTQFLLEQAETQHYKVGIFLPQKSKVTDDILAHFLSAQYPNIVFQIYRCNTPFLNENSPISEHTVSALKTFCPDILLSALGAPYQEHLVHFVITQLHLPLIGIGIGGSLDVIAEVLPRAPRFMCFIGLEWLWRFCQEPQYRWKRVGRALFLFPWKLLLSRIKLLLSGKKSFSFLLAISILLGFFVFAAVSFADTDRNKIQKEIEDVNNRILLQKEKIDMLLFRMKKYQQNIQAYQKQNRNLQEEFDLLELKLAEAGAEIEQIEAEMEASDLSIQNVTLKILDKELVISQKKQLLLQGIRKLERTRRKNAIDVLVSHASFSSYYNEMKSSEDVEETLMTNLRSIKNTKNRLLEDKKDLEASHQNLLKLAGSLQEKKQKLEEQQAFKTYLIAQTERSEEKYQELLEEAKKDQLSINAEIIALDKALRDKLKELERIGRSNQSFVWPIEPTRGISTYFHDKDYPYRYLFEHPGLDIPAKQGTIIAAPRDGYVGRIRSPEEVGKGYAYLMLVHDDGFSTVFGHISCVKVAVDTLVKQGDPIACVGGTPGTAGAGNLTTGAHAHFEIRKDGIPVDPMKYLP